MYSVNLLLRLFEVLLNLKSFTSSVTTCIFVYKGMSWRVNGLLRSSLSSLKGNELFVLFWRLHLRFVIKLPLVTGFPLLSKFLFTIFISCLFAVKWKMLSRKVFTHAASPLLFGFNFVSLTKYLSSFRNHDSVEYKVVEIAIHNYMGLWDQSQHTQKIISNPIGLFNISLSPMWKAFNLLVEIN